MTKQLTPLRRKDVETGRTMEREQVEKWLLETAAIFDKYLAQTPATKADKCIEYASHRDSCRWAAQAIKRGDHVK